MSGQRNAALRSGKGRYLTLSSWIVFVYSILVTAFVGWLANESMDRLDESVTQSVIRQHADLDHLVQVNGQLALKLGIAASAPETVSHQSLLEEVDMAIDRIKHNAHLSELSPGDASGRIQETLLNVLRTTQVQLSVASNASISRKNLVYQQSYERLKATLDTIHNQISALNRETTKLLTGLSDNIHEMRVYILLFLAAFSLFVLSAFIMLMKRRSAENRLSMMRQRMVDSIETISEGFVLFDNSDNLILCNTRYRQLFSADVQDTLFMMPYKDVAISLIQSDTHSVTGLYFRERLEKFLKWHQAPVGDFELEHASGLVFQIREYKTPNGDTVGLFHDVTQLVDAHKHMQRMARTDHITGLLSRAYFEEVVANCLEFTIKNNKHAALMFIDLDRFKIINDSFGHPAGDSVLKHVAGKLQSYASVKNLFARYGGDEFALFVNELPNDGSAPAILQALAENILHSVSGNISIGPAEAYITASIGIAVFPEHGNTLEMMLKSADTAAYHAKSLGGNNVQIYNDSMHFASHRRIEVERHLRMALTRRELFIEYQPQYEASTSSFCGLEALARWRNGQLGMISPAEFIPLAEETGLIFTISNWILREVCRQVAEWRDEGLTVPPISVNLSARQFRDKNLFLRINSTLTDYQLSPSCITIEITETTMLENIENAVETVNRLTQIGVKLAIDDFGTDYSSMSAIKRFKVDTIKIDHSFIRDIENHMDSLEIVSAIINMAHNMGITIVAEGVENEKQVALLRECECDTVQGFYFSPAISAKQAGMLISGSNVRIA